MTQLTFKGPASDLQKLFCPDPLIVRDDLEYLYGKMKDVEEIVRQVRNAIELGNYPHAKATTYSLDMYIQDVERELNYHLNA